MAQKGQNSVANSSWRKLKIRKQEYRQEFRGYTEDVLKRKGQQKWRFILPAQEPTN